MQKEKVLVCDNSATFLKMFKRKFKEEFDFFEELLLNDRRRKEFDHVIYVINDRKELLNFLSQKKNDSHALVCLFDIHLYRSISFLEETYNFILFDESKTRTEILKELKKFFRSKLDFTSEKESFKSSKVSRKRFLEYYKAIYFLM
ncbi:hypothetical protein [Flavobacterium sp. KACC 22763]|uniref:hypothetical protein n=1 Tax=Flavobacterium sp. KACC 22763 TaxID=3025668 RepID=UPI002366B108|nr:hypothetical protein [Flavobacterium sp. KACC 22763]WDF66354.1 hypothetical protein PQ463_09315 [Flavobacterium sp. KACC 22763]